MHITRQTSQELVVVAGTRWVSAICAAAALFTLYAVIIRHEPKGLFLVAFFLLFALIMDLRKTFIFDATERVVRWHGRRVFKAESGKIPSTRSLESTRKPSVQGKGTYQSTA